MHSESQRGVEVTQKEVRVFIEDAFRNIDVPPLRHHDLTDIAGAMKQFWINRIAATNPTTGWQSDIDNAPRDGTRVLLYPPMMTGWWEDGDETWMLAAIHLDPDTQMIVEQGNKPAMWYCLYADYFGADPTHWQPLPPPPTTPPAGGEHE